MSSSLDEFERLMALLDGKPAPQRAGEASIHKDAATLRAELAQLCSNNQGSNWQPIDTAPAHQSVLVYIPERGGYQVAAATFEPEEGWYIDNRKLELHLRNDPTHWQPLPPPPKEAANEDGL